MTELPVLIVCGILAMLALVLLIAFARASPLSAARLQQQNSELLKTVAQLKSQILDLELHNKQLCHFQGTSEGYIAQVAHELRAPLTLLVAPLESLLAGNHGLLRRTQKQSLEIMHNNALRMLQIIIGLLDHAAAREGQIVARREPTDINALTAAIVTDFMPYFEQKQVTCTLAVASEDVVIDMDRYVYERILFNLLSNAAKFTRKSGSVSVSLSYGRGRLQLNVRDTGDGIAEAELGNLFKRFHQLHGAASRRFEGTGLGLPLVKEFAELLEGGVSVESRGGEGTTFLIDIAAPLSAEGCLPEPAEARSFKKPLPTSAALSCTAGKAPSAEPKARLLIADDNLEVAQYMEQLLSPLADIKLSCDGREALELLYEWNPHVLIADVRMPGMTGIELCRTVKSNEETAHIEVVLLSALTNRETMLQAWESGANDYLFKPFHPSELVTRLRTLIDRIHERAKFDTRLQSLSRTLEQRLNDLDTANEELRWLTKELQSARDHAVCATRTKSQFLANMSHEIRTPLNGLIATTELLMQTELTEEQHEYVSISRESALALLETVNDVLDFSHIESGNLSLEKMDFDVLALVEGAAELMSARAGQKNLSLMTYVSNDVPSKLYGDPTRLRQVLIHLLSNAIKFTEHGEVVCRVTVEGFTQPRVQLRFSVYDTGVGMPRSVQRTLFEPFAQADSSMTRQHSGAGLGLSIARRLVELMGGTIAVDSTEGQGSTFWFVVPLENRTAEAVRLPVPDTLRNLRVLMVDGMPETQKVILEYANSWHMKCVTTATASEGLALMGRWEANHKPFDLVIVDFAVADMHPFTLARYIHNSPNLSGTRLILLTSAPEDGGANRALKCGYAGFLTKPIKQSQLFDCIASVMQGHPIFDPSLESGVPQRQSVQAQASSLNESSSPLILVVEDNAINQRVARLQLEELGYRVHIVSNGNEALESTLRLRYDAILMDCAMPVLDGYEATSRIRKQEALIGRHTPIIALTAHSLPGDRERCLECGMDDYLSKPIGKDELGQAIERWVRPQSTATGTTPSGKPTTTNGGLSAETQSNS